MNISLTLLDEVVPDSHVYNKKGIVLLITFVVTLLTAVTPEALQVIIQVSS